MNVPFPRTVVRSAFLKFALAASLLCAAVPAAATAVLWGSSGEGTNPGSIFRLDTGTGAATLVGQAGTGNGISAVAVDPQTGALYGISGGACSGATLVRIDQTTGAASVIGNVQGMGFGEELATSPQEPGESTGDNGKNNHKQGNSKCPGGSDSLTFGPDGTLYVGGWNGGTAGGKILTVDKVTGSVLANHATDVVSGNHEPSHLAGLATAPDGTIWAARGENVPATLHTIDPDTGHFTRTVTLQDNNVEIFGLAFDDNGVLYGAIPHKGQLVTIGTSGGQAGKIGVVGSFGGGETIAGLALLGVTVAAMECSAAKGGCNPTGGHTLQLPAGYVPPADSSITQKKLVLTDPRVASGRCGRDPLVLFADDPSTPNLIIPTYLCGSPQFVVLATESDLSFGKGTLVITNQPGKYFDQPLSCNTPIEGDPQQQDVMVWQTTDSSDLEEGHALELTFECGSARGLTRGLSYFVVGMHIDFGLDWDQDPWSVRAAFVDLTDLKLHYLTAAVVNAEAVLNKKDYKKLLLAAGMAQTALKQASYDRASGELSLFIELLGNTAFGPSSFNHSGNLEMRARNARFMIDEKIISLAH